MLLHSTFLYWVIGTVGMLATIYTCAGISGRHLERRAAGLMLLGGTLVTLGYVMWTTGTGPSDWWETASRHSAGHTTRNSSVST